MPRTKAGKRSRKQCQDEVRESLLHLSELKKKSALENIDNLEKKYKEQVDKQIDLFLSRTSKQLLSTKLKDVLNLGLKRFEAYEARKPSDRSRTDIRIGRVRSVKQKSDRSRLNVQSVDRATVQSKFALVRWPNENEKVHSISGSPLAVQCSSYSTIKAHIPTKTGVVEVKPLQMLEVERKFIDDLDQKSLNDVKILLENISLIVRLVNQMNGKKK